MLVLQFKLGPTGAKQMCDRGACGSCTVIMDGRAVLPCSTLAVEREGKAIETVEGIAANPKWESLIDSYCGRDAMQCGYCTPGFAVSAKTLLEKKPNPNEDQRKQALAGSRIDFGRCRGKSSVAATPEDEMQYMADDGTDQAAPLAGRPGASIWALEAQGKALKQLRWHVTNESLSALFIICVQEA